MSDLPVLLKDFTSSVILLFGAQESNQKPVSDLKIVDAVPVGPFCEAWRDDNNVDHISEGCSDEFVREFKNTLDRPGL